MIKLNPSRALIEALRAHGSLPVDLEDGKVITQSIELALKNAIPIKLIKKDYLATERKTARPFYLSMFAMLKLKALTKERQALDQTATFASVAYGLLAGLIDAERANQQPRRLQAILRNSPVSLLETAGVIPRAEQITMIEKGSQGLSQKPDAIVLSEASTGVGKSYALACLAIDHAKKQPQNHSTVLAAPTYQVAKQLLLAVEQLIRGSDLSLSVALYRSRAEYIDLALLQDRLVEFPNEAASALTNESQFFRSAYEALGVDCRQLLLSRRSVPNNPAEIAYQTDRAETKQASIIVCTHALLGIHVDTLIRRAFREGEINYHASVSEKGNAIEVFYRDLIENNQDDDAGLLPATGLLLIDEAHLLYDSYLAIRSNRASLSVLSQQLKKCHKKKILNAKIYAESIEAVEQFKEAIMQSAQNNSCFSAQITQKFVEQMKPLSQNLSKKTNNQHAAWLLNTLDDLYEIAASNHRMHELYISPIRHHISIKSIAYPPVQWLDLTWRIATQAYLTSGTLAVASKGADYIPIAIKIGVPLNRMVSIPPIETPWLRKNVTLYVPRETRHQSQLGEFIGSAFLPVNNEPGFSIWCREQATYITRQLRADTVGGSLIFCTSYEQVDALHKRLKKAFPKKTGVAVIRSIRGVSSISTANQYKERYFEGLRPVWVAIMTVGTGTDLTDNNVSPDHDQLISNLFVTRAPLRSDLKSSLMNNVRDGVITLRQALGRLVRRPGRKDLNIFIMDARLNQNKGPMRLFQNQINHYEHILIHGIGEKL